jgi:hypothetical protein
MTPAAGPAQNYGNLTLDARPSQDGVRAALGLPSAADAVMRRTAPFLYYKDPTMFGIADYGAFCAAMLYVGAAYLCWSGLRLLRARV